MAPSPRRAALHKDGYVLVPQLLSADELSTLRAAAQRTTALARSGQWPHIRTVGRQFPPWPSTPPSPDSGGGGIWGVQGLLNPALPDCAAFTRNYFGDPVLDVAKELMGRDEDDGDGDGDGDCGDEHLVMELFNLLVRPERDFSLRWHRDDMGPEATAAEETARLAPPRPRCRQAAWHTQWNLALYDDASLVVVPGSHARARTEAERAADPYAADMPGQRAVRLAPGDAVFYDNNILHRGVYDARAERMSLHGSVGRAGGAEARARNVLQHGVGEWVGRCDFSCLGGEGDRVRRRAEGMRARLVEMGRESGDRGYSQRD